MTRMRELYKAEELNTQVCLTFNFLVIGEGHYLSFLAVTFPQKPQQIISSGSVYPNVIESLSLEWGTELGNF